MGTCTVCESTASRNDEFLVQKNNLSRLSSQSSHRRHGSMLENQPLNLDEEQKYALQPSNSHVLKEGARFSSFRDSPRIEAQPEEAPSNLNYRKDFPIFSLTDVIGCISTDYLTDYDTETVIYTGKISKVTKAIHRTTKTVRVLKNISKRNAYNLPIERLKREPEILAEIDHPHVLRGLGYYEAVDHIVIVSDYCRGKSLKELLKAKTFTEEEVNMVMKQIFSGISYLHMNGIIHRNIQPSNILFEDESDLFSLKICGYVNAVRTKSNEELNEEVKMEFENYSAPEIFKKRCSEKADIWSAGTILYELLCGAVAFEGKTREQTIEMINKENFKMEGGRWDKISVQAKDLVRKLIKFEPQKRLSATEALNHIWLKDRGEVYPKESTAATKLLKDCLTHMKQYKRVRKGLVQASWLLMSLLFSKNYEKSFHVRVFTLIDEVNNGKLTAEELVTVYSQYWKTTEAQDFATKVFKEIDVNKRGKISYSEFLISAKDPNDILTDEHLESLFKVIDMDKDGVISKDDLQKTFDKTMRFKNENIFADMRESALAVIGCRQSEKLDLPKFKKLMTVSIEHLLSISNLE